ncbi:VOC family protein [Rhodobacteraceae bacterium D3-12]|nr:VOC family protein [Rhodobacteraceae bacterium D3-12]
MTTKTLGLVALLVPDYDVAIRFFRDVMGFALEQDEDQGRGKRWVVMRPSGGGTGLLLARAVSAEQSAAIGNQAGGRVGFILNTDDFAADHARMVAAGVSFEEEPRQEAYGTVAVFRDLFGNRWDLLELQ